MQTTARTRNRDERGWKTVSDCPANVIESQYIQSRPLKHGRFPCNYAGALRRWRNQEGVPPKSGNERRMPLRSDARKVIRRLSREREDELDGPVFTDRQGKAIKRGRVTKRFKFFVRTAKLKNREDLSIHSLRHTTGSWLAMRGVPIQQIQAILGHSTTNVTERYSHLAPDTLDRAMEETFGN